MNEPTQPTQIEMDGRRKLFLITFVDESENQPPLPPGQSRTMNVPAFVENFGEAQRVGEAHAANFANTPEGKQNKDAKIRIQSISYGGTILT